MGSSSTISFRLSLLIHVLAFLSSLRTAGPGVHDVAFRFAGDVKTIAVARSEEHGSLAIAAGGGPSSPPPALGFRFVVPGSSSSSRQNYGFHVVFVQELHTTNAGAGGVVWGSSSIPWWEWDSSAATGPSALVAALCRLTTEAYCGSFCRERVRADGSYGEKKKQQVRYYDDDGDALVAGDDDKQQQMLCRLRCVTGLACHTLGTGADAPPEYSVIFDRLRWLVMNPLSLGLWILLAMTWIIGTAGSYYLVKSRRVDIERRTKIRTIQYFSANGGVDLPKNTIASVASIDFPTMRRATGGFSKRNIIGEGGFSIVYKGKLPKNHVLASDLQYQRKIAVKRLKPSALCTKGSSDFTREVELMSRLKHGNLVRLLAYCTEGQERILVYEYMRKRSLDVYIFGTPKTRASLDWAKRLEIIHGMAQGINYLHEVSGETVIHRDLKPSNVLLDDELTPKLADFGTSKPLVADDDTGTQTIVFSPGYAAPEYIRGDVTLKCDVYSFGVVLLEIISGQKNSSRPSLLSKAWKLWDEHRIMDLVDSSLMARGGCSDKPELLSRVRRCIQIGLLCVQESPGDRPTMSQVSAMLAAGDDDDSSRLTKPKAPAVFDDHHH